jgi:hypothetical protein
MLKVPRHLRNDQMSATEEPMGQEGAPPSEEELRAAYEAEIKKIRIEHVLLEHVVSLVNLGMRRTGLAPGTEDERDPAQVRLAIEAIRAVLPLVEQAVPEQAKPIRDALSQLQLAYVRIGGRPEGEAAAESAAGAGARAGAAGAPGAPGTPEAPGPAGPSGPPQGEPESAPGESGNPGPAQRSGKLWVPGQ